MTNPPDKEPAMGAYSVAEAKAHLSALLDSVEAGETIKITRRGVEIAAIVPAAQASQIRPANGQFDLAALKRLRDSMPPTPVDSVKEIRAMREADDARHLPK
jgi:prevent-host-death family protein